MLLIDGNDKNNKNSNTEDENNSFSSFFFQLYISNTELEMSLACNLFLMKNDLQ